MGEPSEEELPGAASGRWRRAGYLAAAAVLAGLGAWRLSGGGSTARPSPPKPVSQSVVELVVPEPTADPFCSAVSPCTVEHTVSAVIAAALDEDAGATLTATETYLSSGIQLTADSLQYRRLEARAGAVTYVVVITNLPTSPAATQTPPAGVRVARAHAQHGRVTVDVVAIAAHLPAQRILALLAGDVRLLTVS